MKNKLLILGGSIAALFFLVKRSDTRKWQLERDLLMHKKCKEETRGPFHDDDECKAWWNTMSDDEARHEAWWNHVYRDKKPF
jgi:hypothetical protein